MKASELIKELQEMIVNYDDQEVIVSTCDESDRIGKIEFMDFTQHGDSKYFFLRGNISWKIELEERWAKKAYEKGLIAKETLDRFLGDGGVDRQTLELVRGMGEEQEK